MKIPILTFLVVLGLFLPTNAQPVSGPLLGILPPGTTVRISSQRPASVAGASQDNPTAARELSNVIVYKGENLRISIRKFPGKSPAYDVAVKGWRFFNDPTAPEEYRNYVQSVPLNTSEPEFTDLAFMGNDAVASESKLDGRPAILLTCPQPPPQLTPQYVDAVLAQVGNAPNRAEIQKKLLEAQAAEAASGVRPPNRVWLDLKSRLPVRAEVDGTTITFAYSAKEAAPSLPPAIAEAIAEKFGQVPPL